MKQYTEDMDQKSPGNKGSLVYAGIKSIVKSSLGKKIQFYILQYVYNFCAFTVSPSFSYFRRVYVFFFFLVSDILTNG